MQASPGHGPLLALLTSMMHWPQRLLMTAVRAYRLLLKPWLGNACRFEPTCSAYALDALHKHGAMAGTALVGWRVLRCHPWCDGGCDPVPETIPNPAAGLFTRFGPTSADSPSQTQKPP